MRSRKVGSCRSGRAILACSLTTACPCATNDSALLNPPARHGSAGSGRSNSGLKNRLAMAAKMIGVKPITAA